MLFKPIRTFTLIGFSNRETDLEKINALLAPANEPELTDYEKKMLRDMRNWLIERPTGCLSVVQRRVVDDLVSRVKTVYASQVPRGREVETPEVLKHLPKKPPGRK